MDQIVDLPEIANTSSATKRRVDGRKGATPDMPSFGSEPTHLKGAGLDQAADYWKASLSGTDVFGRNRLTRMPYINPGLLNTAAKCATFDQQGTLIAGGGTRITNIAAPAGASYLWVRVTNGVADFTNPVSTEQTLPSNLVGQFRAVTRTATGGYILSQVIDAPYTLVDDTGGPTPPATNVCDAFTNGTVVGQRTYQTDVKIVVSVNGSCKQARWSNGDGLVHRNWLLNNNSTAINGFTIANIGQCLTFDGESCTGSTPPNPCAFTVSVNPANPSATAGASVQLTAQCSGQCDGVSYSWSGNGLNASGTSVNLTAPGSVGNYTYSLTASKANCANQTASAQLTVTGGGSSGSRCAAFTNGTQVAYWSGNPGTYTVKVRDDGTCRQAVWLNGDVVHPNWQGSLTAKPGFTMADVIYCLAFQDEACKRPASITPAPAPGTAFAVGSTGTPGQADESAARVSSGARVSETTPAPPETGSELVAYPNPTSDVLTVRLDQPLPANPVFTLTDMAGRSYEVGSHLSVLSARRIKLSVRHLMTGQYILQIGVAPAFGGSFRPRLVRFLKQ